MQRHSTFHAGDHQILDAHVGERAARHDSILATSRAVAVEVLRLDALLDQIAPGRRILFDRAGRADMVRRHRVAEDRQRTRAADVGDRAGLSEFCEERRLLNVRRILIPFVKQTRGRWDLIPERILIREVGVACVPGSSFYSVPERGAQQVRFCFCKKDETLNLAAERLGRLRSKI